MGAERREGWTVYACRDCDSIHVLDAKCSRPGAIATDADLRLMSAAPDLLAVVEDLASIPPRDCPWGCDKNHRLTCPASYARTLAAKARGLPHG